MKQISEVEKTVHVSPEARCKKGVAAGGVTPPAPSVTTLFPWKFYLKGQCHEIFCFWFFSWNSFPPAPEYSIKTISNFFENSLKKYSQLKVCHRCQQHRWQMEKIFNQKNLVIFVWSPLGSRGNIYINFCLQVHFQVSAAWYCSHYLPLVAMTPVANLPRVSLRPVAICHRRRWHRRQISSRYRWHVANLPPVSTTQGDLVAKFAAGVVDTAGKFATGVVDTGGAPWLANISVNFLKKFEMILMLLSGAWGKVIHEKNINLKSRDTVPLKKTYLSFSSSVFPAQLTASSPFFSLGEVVKQRRQKGFVFHGCIFFACSPASACFAQRRTPPLLPNTAPLWTFKIFSESLWVGVMHKLANESFVSFTVFFCIRFSLKLTSVSGKTLLRHLRESKEFWEKLPIPRKCNDLLIAVFGEKVHFIFYV